LMPKMYTYTIVAIALGYMLISVVPAQVALLPGGEGGKPEFLTRTPGAESDELMGGEIASAPEGATDSMKAEASGDMLGATEAAKAAADAASEAANAASSVEDLSRSLDYVNLMGTWAFNLILALGVYYVARRRFT